MNSNVRTIIETTLGLLKQILFDRMVVSGSGIAIRADVGYLRVSDVNLPLVGEAIMRAADSGAELARMFS